MDLIRNKGKLLENVVKFTNEYEFSEVLYISSVTGENINLLLDNIKIIYMKDQSTIHLIKLLIKVSSL